MSARQTMKPLSLFVTLFTIPLVVGYFGCSGSTTTSENSGGSTSGVGGNLSGGNSGLGGTSSNGGKASSGGVTGGVACNYNGNIYGVGSQIPMGDGCNICICSAGSTPIMQCTTHVCPGSGDASSSTGGARATGGATSAGGSRSTGGQSTNGGGSGSGSSPCGGCAMGEICIFQNGGPGPSHYTCATQLPCGAAGACSCIVNQGTCSYAPGDAGVAGICSCNNGLN